VPDPDVADPDVADPDVAAGAPASVPVPVAGEFGACTVALGARVVLLALA
jgi:hypothetical protein